MDSVKSVNNSVRSLFRRDVDIKSVYNVLKSWNWIKLLKSVQFVNKIIGI